MRVITLLVCHVPSGKLTCTFIFHYDWNNSQTFKMALGGHHHPDGHLFHLLGRGSLGRESRWPGRRRFW